MLRKIEREVIGKFGVFVAYRREDVPWAAVRIYDRLERFLPAGRIFMDIEAIPIGVNFVDFIGNAVSAATAVVCVIGPRWLDVRDEDGRRRLDNEYDVVRLEIELALKKGIRINWVSP